MISLKFSIPLEEVEQRPITEYRLMLFTIFNTVALEMGMGDFKWRTEAEEVDEVDRLVDFYRKKGFFNGRR